jgi:hypothetical protein
MADKYVNIVRVDVPPEIGKENDEWYAKEHFPRLLSVPGVLSAKRYKLVEGDGPRHTPWGDKIQPQLKN